jgi:hypothetical protein
MHVRSHKQKQERTAVGYASINNSGSVSPTSVTPPSPLSCQFFPAFGSTSLYEKKPAIISSLVHHDNLIKANLLLCYWVSAVRYPYCRSDPSKLKTTCATLARKVASVN